MCISTFAVCILTSRWSYLYLVGTQELLQSDLTHLTIPMEFSYTSGYLCILLISIGGL